MDEFSRPAPDLERLAAEEFAGHLERVPLGEQLLIDPSAPLCGILELLIPDVLRRASPEWEEESIDGFFFSSAVKSGDRCAELAGTCILISDQAVTPFSLSVRLANPHRFESLRIRLGEPGGGPLEISGPPSNSRAASQMLHSLPSRIHAVRWAYDVAISTSQ